ncbi:MULTISPECIES: GNAT family N-acetyltransferase [Nocardia]|uniref:GNAT family N-acetyltransferase n=1 Tax=Nocardia TaxID=1817 RepID=UPI00030D567F|nr:MULTISPECIES: GNAT family N-acetyltransferase [Nocardia]
MIVRQLQPDEWTLARTVRLDALRETPPGTFGSTFDLASRWSERQWRQWMHGRVLFIAETTDGTAVGSVGGMIEDDLPAVVSMWVAPAHRGTGLSDRLLAAVIDWAITGRHHQIRLWALEHNHTAHAFYRRNGFTNTGKRKRCIDWPDRFEIEMSRVLTISSPLLPDELVAAAPADDTVRQVIDAEMRLLDPAVRASPQALAVFLAPSFIEFGASGRRWDRDSIIAALAAEPPTTTAATQIRGQLLSPDLAHVTYIAERDGQKSLRSSLWRRTDDGWRMYFHQGTPVADKSLSGTTDRVDG